MIAIASGQRFGRLVAIVSTRVRNQNGWECRCDCGQLKLVRSSHLAQGVIRSCGCLKRDHRKHGLYKTPEYHVWTDMNRRCRANYKGYEHVEVCEQWRTSFEAFLAYIGPRPGPRFSIDRIDPFGNYELGNVRWATPKEQSNNRRPVVGLTVSAQPESIRRRQRQADRIRRARLQENWLGESVQLPLFDRRFGLVTSKRHRAA